MESEGERKGRAETHEVERGGRRKRGEREVALDPRKGLHHVLPS